MTDVINPLLATGQLPPVEWLNAPETMTLTKALTADHTEVRFVGGCVRDAMRHQEAKDIDIATPDHPEQVIKLLKQANIHVIPTGLKHGTVTAVVGGRQFEITTLRIDLGTDGRHATVGFTDDWLEDARRRDFTINALSADLQGNVFDPFSGFWDLAHGVIRFIGSAHDRVAEDYLRILRYFRFYGAMGRPPIDSEAIAACRAYAKHLPELSGERIRSELLKILSVPDPAEILIKMKGAEVLEQILPEARDPGLLRMVNWLATRAVVIEGIKPDPIRHLAAAVCETTSNVKELSDRLKLSNHDRDRLQLLCNPPLGISPDMSEIAENKALRKFGCGHVIDLILLKWGQEMYAKTNVPFERKQSWIAMLERVTRWTSPEFPLSGRDVMALGIEAGPQVGKLLGVVEAWWESHGYHPNRQACLNRLFDETNRL